MICTIYTYSKLYESNLQFILPNTETQESSVYFTYNVTNYSYFCFELCGLNKFTM